MSSNDMPKNIPTSPEEWEAAYVAAPGEDRSMTPEEEARWSEAIFVNGGGYQAVRAAMAAKRKQGDRGAQVNPTKQLVSVRYSPEVLEFFRASGAGWQSRMDEVLKEWVTIQKRSS